ncbi:hypothetical protein J2847_006439 [Azospirillum agricola]|uniref:replication protein RepA n=1 Tax=Azospirillum agricola TaxID=1720247 RepID=UPI002D80261E|nr:replication protein RepA [Azospirillum agricola]MBP2233104.1 hypothetical protein [Azospirillum agricola]
MLADETRDTGFSYSGFALTAFPYKKLPTDASWTKDGHQVTMTVDPGSLKVAGKVRKYGVPYGASARLVMIYLQSEAVRTSCPTVELGRSLRAFATERLGLEWGGSTGKALQDQIYRLSACSLKFFWSTARSDHFECPRLIRSGSFAGAGAADDPQARLWDDSVTLDDEFYKHLRLHAVPLLDAAVRALADEPVALDMYVWLAYRLRSLDRPTPMSWAALKEQFGGGYKTVRQFKYKAGPSLRRALAAYPEAVVTIEDKEIVLYPSRPPIARSA